MDSQTENSVCQQPETVSRPRSLGILIFVTDLFLIFGVLGSLPGTLEGNPWAVATLLGIGFQIFLLHGIYKGRYWAWVAVQGWLSVGILAWVAIRFSSPRGFAGVSIAETTSVVAVLAGLIVYLRGKKVKKFCASGPLDRADKQGDGQLIIVRRKKEREAGERDQ
jgi:hypothetical protein